MRSSFAAIFLAFSIWIPSTYAADILLAPGVTVAPGQSAGLPLSLAAAAPPGGVFVSLASSDLSKVTVAPTSLYVPSGMTSPPAQPQVTGVNYGSATIYATAYGLAGGSQTVRVSGALFGPASETIQRGATRNVTFTLASPTPTPLTIALASDNPGVASVPASVTIPANGTAAAVPVTGQNAGSTVIHAGAPPDVAEHAVNVTVVAPATMTLSGSASVALGQSAPFPVTLGTPAGAGGVVVTLTSDDTFSVTISPGSVFVPAGATAPATQPQVTGANIGSSRITASAPGYLPASRDVLVTSTITMSPQTLVIPSGSMRQLSMALSAAAPSIDAPITGDRAKHGRVDGLTVLLTSSDARVATLQPTVLFYPDGSSITTVVVQVTGVAPGTAVIHASAPPFIPDTTATVIVTSSGAGTAASISAAGGTPQTAAVNTPFGAPLAATVRDASGNPVAGVAVTFTAPPGGATAIFAGGVNTATTNASGVATSQTITAGGTAGTYVVAASVTGVVSMAVFTLTNAPAAPGSITLPSDLMIGPSQSAALALVLTTPAPAGGVSIALGSSDPSKVQVAPASVFIPGGSTTPVSQPQVTGINFGSATIGASSLLYTSASQTVRVGATLTLSPSTLTVSGFVQQTLTLRLSWPAPAGGLTISLSSNNPGVATVPPSVVLPANTTTVAVPVTGVALGSAAITASAAVPNVPNGTASVIVASSADIVLASGVTVAPGQSAGLPLSLAAAPPGGVFVSLASSDLSKVTVAPTSLYVPSGMTSPPAQPQVTGVNYGSATIYATAYGLAGGSQTVRVSGALFGPASETIQRGATRNVTFTLASPTPTPLTIALASDNPGVASVPAGVTIPANGTAVAVPVTGQNAGSTVIHAGAPPHIAEHAVNVTVVAPATMTLSGSASVALGQSAPFPVTLGTPAGAGGVVVTLTSDDTFSVTISPGSVFVPAGATTPATQPQVTGANIGTATIAASAPGYLPASRDVLVTSTITMSPQTLVIPSGSMRLLSMALSAAAPSIDVPITGDRGKHGWVNGLTVLLTSSDARVATLQPTVLFYPDGSSITTVVVLVTGVAPGTAVIHASAPPFIPDTTATVIVQ